MTRQDILDHLANALNGLGMGWQMANVQDDAKRNELQAPINSGSESIIALLKHFDPIAD
jgi:hypothetical protein